METIFNLNKLSSNIKFANLKKSTIVRYVCWLIKGDVLDFEIPIEFKQLLYEEAKRRADNDLEALKKHLGV